MTSVNKNGHRPLCSVVLAFILVGCYEINKADGGDQECWGHGVVILYGVVKVGLIEEVADYVLVGKLKYSDM